MKITVTTAEGSVVQLDVSADESIENVKALVEVELGIPLSHQLLTFNGAPLGNTTSLTAAGVGEGDLVMVQRTMAGGMDLSAGPAAAPSGAVGGAVAGGAGAGSGRADSPTNYAGLTWEDVPGNIEPNKLHKILQQNPRMLQQLRVSNPKMHEAASNPDPAKLRAYFLSEQMEKAAAQLEEQQWERRLAANPMDTEAQAKLEEAIRLRNVESNRQLAMEEMPEAFFRVHMLYVDAEVNGVKLKAFVDSGAQNTIMSKQCAEKCGIMRLVDTRFAGQAVGVGSAPIVGKVHIAQLKIGKTFFNCSFTVLDQPDMEFLFGLDMLKRHRCLINLRDNVLQLEGASGTESVPFLSESEVPRSSFNPRSPTPTPASPGGTGGGAGAGAGVRAPAPATPPPPAAAAAPAPAPAAAPATAPAPASGGAAASDPVSMFGLLPESMFGGATSGGGAAGTAAPPPPAAAAAASGSASTTPAAAADASAPAVDESKVTTLTNMGFSRAQAVEALTVSGGDPQRALNYLMSL